MIVNFPCETASVKSGAVSLPPKLRDVCFDFNRGVYWILNERGSWITVNETAIKRHLRASGISPAVTGGIHVSPLDERLMAIQERMDVHYAGPLAGWEAGIYTMSEKRVLVTESPRLPRSTPGGWPVLKRLIDGLLLDGDCDQRPYLFGWLKVGLEAFRSRQRRPGQALALCGPHDCGKSLLQILITELFGGRAAKPYQFMTGQTPFNSDLFEAEHLMIEDDQSSTDLRARRSFGAQIKNITVNDTQRCHPKSQTAITLSPFWRISITINDEPENLATLPPLDDSIEDKLILLRAFKQPMPMPTQSNEERRAFWSTLTGELPAFIHFLEQWDIPNDLKSPRFGITHYHHPDLLNALDSLSPEKRILEAVDAILFQCPSPAVWSGSAAELGNRLTASGSHCGHDVRKLLLWPGALGTYLGRIAKRHPSRFIYRRSNSSRGWTIHPPHQPSANVTP